MKLIFSPEAIKDLSDLSDYIYLHNPEASKRFRSQIKQRIQLIADTPMAYPLFVLVKHANIHRYAYQDYSIFYRVNTTSVEIIHILHSARDISQFFPDDTQS